jgi:hypothetical protein
VLGGRLSGAWGVEARITSKDVVESDTAEFSKHNEVVVAARYLFVHGAFTWHAAAGPVFIAGQEATTGIYQFSEVEGDVYEFRRTTTYKGRAGLGGLAAFGFTFQDPYNPGLAFLAEVNARLASWRPKEAMVDEYRKVEEGFTLVSETETSYVETYSGNDGPAFPMSSWGFRVGLQFRIGAIKKAGGPAEKAGQ